MIRVLSGSVIPVLGLGAAIMLLGPDQLTGPRGEPLVVDAPTAAAVQRAGFDGQPCATPLLFSEEDRALAEVEGAGVKALTITFGFGADGTAVEVEDGVTHPDSDAAVVVLFDAGGEIVAIMPSRINAALTRADCPSGDEPQPAGI
jgi:hypothetical protein